jgi:Ataxin-3
VDHWIAIRKLYGVWYNLNSTNIVPPGPQIISDFYLAAFLDSIKNSGYTIFVIRQNPAPGSQPLPLPKKQVGLRSNQLYVKVNDIAKYHKENKNRKLNAGGADERELEEAL